VDELARTLREQAGVISRGQALELGLSPVEVTRLVRRREWVPVHRGVYVEHDGPLTWLQRAWAAVLFSWPAHSSTEERDRDLERDLEAVVDRTEETVRLGYGQVFDRGCASAAKIGRILQRKGWAGEISPCAKCGGFVQPG
jgi:hypothetical protein